MNQVLTLLLLLYPAAADLKEKEFYALPVLSAGAGALIYRMAAAPGDLRDALCGAAVGAVLLLYAGLTRGAIGAGDAVCTAIIGVLNGPACAAASCLVGFLAASAAGMILIAAGKATWRSSLPFVPFLTAAYALLCLTG